MYATSGATIVGRGPNRRMVASAAAMPDAYTTASPPSSAPIACSSIAHGGWPSGERA